MRARGGGGEGRGRSGGGNLATGAGCFGGSMTSVGPSRSSPKNGCVGRPCVCLLSSCRFFLSSAGALFLYLPSTVVLSYALRASASTVVVFLNNIVVSLSLFNSALLFS